MSLPHYSDHDPARGCGCLTLVVLGVILLVLTILVVARVLGLWT